MHALCPQVADPYWPSSNHISKAPVLTLTTGYRVHFPHVIQVYAGHSVVIYIYIYGCATAQDENTRFVLFCRFSDCASNVACVACV